tara:strand:+ start:92 stop:1036 length:945 start_codon:yes stop_codon:yes gene_type:complete
LSSYNDFDAQLTPDQLTIKNTVKGKHVGTSAEKEVTLKEQHISPKIKLALTVFSPENKDDITSYKIIKYKLKNNEWQKDSQVSLSKFGLEKIEEFNRILISLDLAKETADTIELDGIGITGLNKLLRSDKSDDLIAKISNSEWLTKDIFALDAKRTSLLKYEELLNANTSEAEWQAYFEENQWIFGLGLNFVSLEKVGSKLEATTTGSDFNTQGKRADALMKSRAEISQFVLAEIKMSTTPLLGNKSYRGGCWAVSSEVSGAVAQAQKTAFEFTSKTFEHSIKDDEGKSLGQSVYSIQPKSFLVVGNLRQLEGN